METMSFGKPMAAKKANFGNQQGSQLCKGQIHLFSPSTRGLRENGADPCVRKSECTQVMTKLSEASDRWRYSSKGRSPYIVQEEVNKAMA